MLTATNKKILLIGLHFLPSIIFTAILFSVMPVLAGTSVDLFFVQIILVTVFLLGIEIFIPQIYCRIFEGRSFWSSLREAKAIEMSWKALVIAIGWSAISVAVMKSYLWIGGSFIEWFRSLPFLALPSWHFQSLDFPEYSPIVKGALLTFMLATNVFAEETYFRGFLLQRLQFLGRYAFLLNGTLFILYHIFQMRVSYPLLPFGLLISGYYVLFRNVWGAMLIHLVLNLAL